MPLPISRRESPTQRMTLEGDVEHLSGGRLRAAGSTRADFMGRIAKLVKLRKHSANEALHQTPHRLGGHVGASTIAIVKRRDPNK